VKKAISQVFRVVGALQIALLILWVASYPLHIAFDFSDADRAASHHAVERANSCCTRHLAMAPCHDDHFFSAFRVRSTCNICDFALQLASSSLSAVFSLQISAACSRSQSGFARHLPVSDFSFYFSRGPPSELIG